jgi:SAM-dependent methyltransferase
MNGSFNEYAQVYNQLYSDKDYVGETNYIDELIQLHRPGSDSILEYGSGTGIHGRLLGELGYRVLGIEPSSSMLAFASETTNFSIRQGDLREHSEYGKSFDACLILFHVFNYLISAEEQKAAFANIGRQLSPGGILLLEVWHGPAVESQQPDLRVKEVEGDFGSILRIARPTDVTKSSVSVNYDIFYRPDKDLSYHRIQETHILRPTYPSEIVDFCASEDFEILATEEFLTKAAPSTNTWSVLYVLRARP